MAITCNIETAVWLWEGKLIKSELNSERTEVLLGPEEFQVRAQRQRGECEHC